MRNLWKALEVGDRARQIVDLCEQPFESGYYIDVLIICRVFVEQKLERIFSIWLDGHLSAAHQVSERNRRILMRFADLITGELVPDSLG